MTRNRNPFRIAALQPRENAVNIVERVKNVIMTPKTEWDVIAGEATQPKDLVITYVLPLAALAAIAGFIGTAVIGSFFLGRFVRLGTGGARLAPHHVNGLRVRDRVRDRRAGAHLWRQKNFNQAIKVAAYSYTPGFVGVLRDHSHPRCPRGRSSRCTACTCFTSACRS
jgi:hypothetical protein